MLITALAVRTIPSSKMAVADAMPSAVRGVAKERIGERRNTYETFERGTSRTSLGVWIFTA
jgi:hypothetical protein